MTEMENGLFLTQHVDERPAGLEVRHRFVTATLRGEPHRWAIRGGDANGGRPPAHKDGAYDPMSKEGAIVLGIGGDNSHTSQGTFYEGVMTSAYPRGDVEDQVQADIARQRYAPGDRNHGGPAVQNDGSKLFAEDATFCIQAGINGQGVTIRSSSQAAHYWRHYDARVHISYPGGKYKFDSKTSFNDDASFVNSDAV